MTVDIKAKIEEIVEKVKNDKGFAESFQKDPVKAVENLLGVDLPDDQLKAIVDGVKSKVKLDNLEGMAAGAVDKLKGLFHKD